MRKFIQWDKAVLPATNTGAKGHHAMTYQPKTGMRFRKEMAELFNNPIIPGSLTVPLLLDDLAACEAALAERDREVERLKAELVSRQCVDCGEPILVH